MKSEVENGDRRIAAEHVCLLNKFPAKNSILEYNKHCEVASVAVQAMLADC